MKKDVLKVIVKEGRGQDFEKYCKEKGIFCRRYSLEMLKTRYRAECKLEQLKGAEIFIKSVEDMPKATLD
ncbi:hypothetical protein [Clostridium felsineum]|uniref:hypothetical protein n=1 Tax=Clostridium felsineum TaxID=36839 RepID=UPI00098C322F|nr:hypothetical protein [Clostridium felsineum]